MNKLLDRVAGSVIVLVMLALFAAFIGVVASVVAKAFMIGWALLS